ATHGEPSELNAHPHFDCTGKIALVHNGIIENYRSLKEYLTKKGHSFTTETDTEVIAHLIEDIWKDTSDFEEALRIALLQLEGTYGLAIMNEDIPDRIYGARHGSPLIIGVGCGENFLASDPTAIIRYTNRVSYLNEGELAIINKDWFEIKTLDAYSITPKVEELTLSLQEIEKGGYPHFMLKEIFEQPETLRNAIRGRLNFDEGTARLNGLKDYIDRLKSAKRIVITACGTSWHASLIGEYLIEQFARIPVEVEYASEFRYRNPILDENTVVFVISQSGETADTLAALREAKRCGVPVLGITNVVGSTIARETDAGVYIHAGPEIGVASTKAFTSQVMVLTLIALMLGRIKGLSAEQGNEIVREITKIPDKVKYILDTQNENIKSLAKKFYKMNNFLYLGRGFNYPVALEGALKLKEISYVHAEGYPAAEMKHGPIALIDKNMPVVFIAVDDPLYEKVISNIEEVRARMGRVIAIATEGNKDIKRHADYLIYVPKTLYFLSTILVAVVLQLFAYHIAVL
ncbi:MAG: glutamine--fructose-6-phosphate transaminase (isomerizing), partial [bacterium]